MEDKEVKIFLLDVDCTYININETVQAFTKLLNIFQMVWRLYFKIFVQIVVE